MSSSVDSSIPDTNVEELLACIHILYRLHKSYAGVDKWLFSSNENMSGDVPIDYFKDGQGLVVLEYLRDIELRAARLTNGGMQ